MHIETNLFLFYAPEYKTKMCTISQLVLMNDHQRLHMSISNYNSIAIALSYKTLAWLPLSRILTHQ